MLYMVVERFADNDMRPVYRHLAARGRGLPAGVRFLGSWVERDHSRCFQLMEADHRELLDRWMDHWAGTGVSFEEVVAVMTGDEARRQVEQGGSG